MTAKELFSSTLSVSEKTQIGLPLGKSYFKPTPKFWRNVGDGLLLVSTIITIVGASVAFPPAVIIVGSVVGVVGKYITNCFSTK